MKNTKNLASMTPEQLIQFIQELQGINLELQNKILLLEAEIARLKKSRLGQK